jgi:hypothetical protein
MMLKQRVNCAWRAVCFALVLPLAVACQVAAADWTLRPDL